MKRIIVVTDLVSTGTQVKAFVKTILANRSILSWYSHHWFDIHLVCYAISARARSVLQRAFPRIVFHSVRAEPTFENSPWTKVQRGIFKDLCEQYQQDFSVSALGYKGQGSLLALGFKVSNTLPPIFWQSRSGWQGLFPGRLVPQEIVRNRKPIDVSVDHELLLRWNDQARAGLAISRYSRNRSRDLVYLLSLARSSRLETERVEIALGISGMEATHLIEYAISCNWLDDEWRLTEAGRIEFKASKNSPRILENPIVAEMDYSYYPTSLR